MALTLGAVVFHFKSCKFAQNVYTYDEHIQVGKTATFITAPKYYGDGYVMPIVSLSIDNQHILEYEIGFPSLLNWLKK